MHRQGVLYCSGVEVYTMRVTEKLRGRLYRLSIRERLTWSNLLMFLIPGAVTPLGLLNDAECKVQLYLDEAFFAAPGLIGVHPNDNTATVWLRADDLAALIQEHGNPVHIAEL